MLRIEGWDNSLDLNGRGVYRFGEGVDIKLHVGVFEDCDEELGVGFGCEVASEGQRG